MKILKEGAVPQPVTPWWHNQTVTCHHCRTEFQLEAGDKVGLGAEKRPNGKQWAVFDCPKCSTNITIYK